MGLNFFLVFATLVATVGAWFDWRSGRRADVGEGVEGEIPNSLTLGALAIAPIAWLVFGWKVGGMRAGFESAGFSVAGALTCGLIPIFLFRAGAMGGGDVKLLAAIGAIIRPMVGIEAEFYAFAAAALLAPARLAWEGKLFKTLANSLALAVNPLLPKDKRREISKESMTWFRFGPAIAVGTLIATILNWRATVP
ncbi:MAG: prepilin peptidase [Polyangiales bacterium]